MSQADQFLLKRGVIFLLLWLVFGFQLFSKLRGYLDTGSINFFGRTWEGDAGSGMLVGLSLASIFLLAVGIRDIHRYTAEKRKSIT